MPRSVRIVTGPGRLGDGPSHLARLEGHLVVDPDGCIYAISAGDGVGRTVVWPSDYTARRGPDDVVEILDGSGNVVLREGDRFAAAGGLGPSTPETEHALATHGRQAFYVGQAVERLPR